MPKTLRRGLTYARRVRAVALAATVLLLLAGSLAALIVVSRQQSRSQIRSTFGLRATTSATFLSEFLHEQARRERQVAEEFLSGRRVSQKRFRLVANAFGTRLAVLLDASGRLLSVTPARESLLGKRIAPSHPHLKAAGQGKVAVSDVVAFVGQPLPVVAIAVPFSTAHGQRVFSAAYRVHGSALGSFVKQAALGRRRSVYLVDGTGRVVAASPTTTAGTLARANPTLARALDRDTRGTVEGAAMPTTFTSASVPGTSWRLVIAVPDSRLYASITGPLHLVPWLVFGLVTILGILLVTLFGRSLADRARLITLSTALERTARTDPLTGLLNRRALAERLAPAAASARRRREPLSVLMIDLDEFKEINDRYGHAAGDRVLRAIADCMRDAFRAEDICGRWGGDEFLVALPATGNDEAHVAAERFRVRAGAYDLPGIELADGIQLSIGVATTLEATSKDLVNAADGALYEAKSAASGRRRSDDVLKR